MTYVKKIRGIIAPMRAALLITALLAATMLAGCTQTQSGVEQTDTVIDIGTRTPTVPPTLPPTAEPTPTQEPTPEPVPAYARLMLVGDLMCLSAQQNFALSKGNGSYDFSSSFRYVKPIFDLADCVIGNLETTLSASWPYATEQRNIDGMPNCNGPAEYLAAVKYAGFDVLMLANNHCCDAGSTGILETLEAIDSYGFSHTGLFAEEDEARYIILDVNGIKVAFLSYAEFYNSKEHSVIADGNQHMINTYSEEVIRRDVAAARAAGAEFVIAYNHWGKEHVHEPTAKVLLHTQQMADAGVDLIAGSHPHALQPIVWLDAADGRKVLCMYSLGNFVSSMGKSTANDTIIADITLERDIYGNVSVYAQEYHPCRVFSRLEDGGYVVVPTSETSIPDIISVLEAAEERILAIIKP